MSSQTRKKTPYRKGSRPAFRFMAVLCYVAQLCAVLPLIAASGCTYDQYTGFSCTSYSDAGSGGDPVYDDNEVPVAEWFLDSGGFTYEKAAAKLYYEGNSEGITVPGSYRSDQLSSRGRYDFDDNGYGVFITIDMNNSAEDLSRCTFYIEYTTDYGESWKICGSGYESSFVPYEAAVNSGKLYILRRSAVLRDSFIMYSGDRCASFRRVSLPSMLPQFGDRLEGRTADMELMNVDESDNSLLFGWYSKDRHKQEKVDDYSFGWGKNGYFLIVKTDSAMRSCQVIYSDGKYIRNRPDEPEQ